MGFTKASEAERREQILAAAESVASRSGLSSLTLRSVAAEAGLSHGSLLFHFGSKDDLLQALFDRVIAWFLEVQKDASATGSAELLGVLDQEMTAARSRPDRAGVLLDFWLLATRDERIRTQLADAVAQYRMAFDATLTPTSNEPDLDTASLADLAVSLVLGTALRRLVADPGDENSYIGELPTQSLMHFVPVDRSETVAPE